MKKMKKSFFKNARFFCIALLLASELSGCAGMNTNFGCNALATESCTPVNEVNQRAQAGVYDNTPSGSVKKIAVSSASAVFSTKSNSGYNAAIPKPGEPIRFRETIQRIWIAPFQDATGNYHEPSFIYTVLKHSHWIGLPAREITSTPEEN